MYKKNFENFNDINADLFLSLGSNCQVAQALARNNLRFFASPFDWMAGYDLNTVLSLLENKGSNFFEQCQTIEKETEIRTKHLIDAKTKMVSKHDIPCNIPDEKNSIYIKKRHKYRFKNLDYLLKKSNSLCILMARKLNNNQIKNFIDKFTQLYKFEKVYCVNIYHTEEEEKYEFEKINNIEIHTFYFYNIHKDGSGKDNPYFWHGNIEYWDEILKKMHLNKNFVDKYKLKRKIFNISYKTSFKEIRKIITIFGIVFKFKENI